MNPIKQVLIIFALALFYFVSAYFAVAALLPPLALPAALIAMIAGLSSYWFLGLTGSDRAGLPFGLLVLFPVICLAAGIMWWLLRLLGLWVVN